MYRKAYMAVWREENREHTRAYSRRYYHDNLAASRERNLKRRSGFTLALFKLALRRQKNRCGICRRDLRKLKSMQRHADHCHRTRQPRGVLCQGCNTGIGWFTDDVRKLTRAIAYLKRPTLKGRK